MVMIPIAYTAFAPALANIVIRTCSFKLKGPGFRENDHLVPGTRIAFFGKVAANSFPIGSTTIWAGTDVTVRKFWRYSKNWFTNARVAQEIRPRSHVRNVKQGKVGSSVTGTVSRTCSIGESFTSSAFQNM